MTVITLKNPPPFGTPVETNPPLPYRQCATLPRKLASKKGIFILRRKHFILYFRFLLPLKPIDYHYKTN